MTTKELPEFEKLAYSIPSFAKAVDLSVTTIREEIDAGRLVPRYRKTKPVIETEEGRRWLKSLPQERRAS